MQLKMWWYSSFRVAFFRTFCSFGCADSCSHLATVHPRGTFNVQDFWMIFFLLHRISIFSRSSWISTTSKRCVCAENETFFSRSLFEVRCSKAIQSSYLFSFDFFSLPTFWFHPTHKIHFTFIAVFLQSRLNCWILNLALPFNFFQLAPAHTHFSLLLRNIYMKFAPPAAEISRLFLCTKKKKQTIYDTKKCMVRVFHQLKRFPCSIWICSFDSLFEWVWEIISLMNVLFALPIPTEIWPIVVQKKMMKRKYPQLNKVTPSDNAQIITSNLICE